MNYKQRDNESLIEYGIRLISIKKEQNPQDLDWGDIVDLLDLDINKDSLRKANDTVFGGYSIYKYMLENCNNDNDKIDIFEKKKQEIFIETQKNRDLLSQIKTLMREQAREEALLDLIDRKFEEKFKRNPIEPPKLIKPINSKKEIVVAFADAHYGADFHIKGFMNETINEYNPKIFMDRMWKLRSDIYNFSKMVGTNKIRIVDLGDSVEGKLHISQLQALKSNVVDDIIDYAEFMAKWLESMQDDFIIDIYTSEGNHSDMRLLTGKKGDFAHENVERIYYRWLYRHFKDNPNINLNANKDGLNYFDVLGYKFLTAHGQFEKNLKTSINEYQNTYGIDINYFLVGHMHSKVEFDVAKNKYLVQVRSLMGLNDYSETIKKTSDAGACIFSVEEGYGRKYSHEVRFD